MSSDKCEDPNKTRSKLDQCHVDPERGLPRWHGCLSILVLHTELRRRDNLRSTWINTDWNTWSRALGSTHRNTWLPTGTGCTWLCTFRGAYRRTRGHTRRTTRRTNFSTWACACGRTDDHSLTSDWRPTNRCTGSPKHWRAYIYTFWRTHPSTSRRWEAGLVALLEWGSHLLWSSRQICKKKTELIRKFFTFPNERSSEPRRPTSKELPG